MDERGASEAAVLVAATGVPHLRQERTIIAKLRVGHHAVVHLAIAFRELGAVLRTDGTLAGKAMRLLSGVLRVVLKIWIAITLPV